jgi:hypothetical protein
MLLPVLGVLKLSANDLKSIKTNALAVAQAKEIAVLLAIGSTHVTVDRRKQEEFFVKRLTDGCTKTTPPFRES